MGGVEPPTYALRMRRSAIEPHQQIECVALQGIICKTNARSVSLTERAKEFNNFLRVRALLLRVQTLLRIQDPDRRL